MRDQECSLEFDLLRSNRGLVIQAKERAEAAAGARLLSLRAAKRDGWAVESVEIGPASRVPAIGLFGAPVVDAAAVVADSPLEVVTVQPWRRGDHMLIKVRGMTHVYPGQWGDDPPDIADGGHHTPDSRFLEVPASAGTAFNPFAAADAIERAMADARQRLLGPERSVEDVERELFPSAAEPVRPSLDLPPLACVQDSNTRDTGRGA